MNLSHMVAACVVAVSVAASARATDRYYSDSFAISANGKYRIDAKSPDNANKNRAFASNFTYTLTEVATKTVIWERKQPMRRSKGEPWALPAEGSPMQVFVSDDGHIAAYLAQEQVLIVDPRGADVGIAEILDAFPKEQQQTFVSMSTAGPIWAHDSEWYFMSATVDAGGKAASGGRPYFVIRPYWCHRLVIDVTTGKHVDLGEQHAAWSDADVAKASEQARPILKAAIAEERRRALEILTVDRKQLVDENDYWFYRRTTAACATVVHLRLVEAEPGLVVLNKLLAEAVQHLGMRRQRVREALRAIGKTPEYSTDSVTLEQRTRNAAKVEKGMTMKQLSELLGAPDAEFGWRDKVFDYDIDATPGYTLRVEFDPTQDSVTSVRTITPFAFFADPDRLRGW